MIIYIALNDYVYMEVNAVHLRLAPFNVQCLLCVCTMMIMNGKLVLSA